MNNFLKVNEHHLNITLHERKKQMNGKPIKLSKYETFKINVLAHIKAHRENFPVLIHYYFKRLRSYLGI